MAGHYFQNEPPPRNCVGITFTIYGGLTAGMVDMVQSFEHPFQMQQPNPESIEISMYGSGPPLYVAGKQLPATVILFDESDALLFKLKFGDAVIETERTEYNSIYGRCDD